MEPVKVNTELDLEGVEVLVYRGDTLEQSITGHLFLQQDGRLVLRRAVAEAAATSPQGVENPDPRIRSYMEGSALVRFMYEGRYATAAVTHVTDRAWRLFNLTLGAAWVPKSVLRWSPVAEQFCIVDRDYYPQFTQDVAPGMDRFPEVFNPEPLIDELYQ